MLKAQTFDLSALISIGNQVIGLVPRLMALAYFVLLVVLTVRVLRTFIARGAIPTMEIAAIAIAFGLAIR